MTEKSTTITNGQTINYYEHVPENNKHDITIVFVHGNTSQFIAWESQYNDPRLQQYHMIAVDLRGFGKSSYINKCSKLSDWASDVIDLLTIKKVNKILLIGWSFGGTISMKIAEMAPQLTETILLTSSCSHKGISHLFDPTPKTIEQLFEKAPMIGQHSKMIQQKNSQKLSQHFKAALGNHEKLQLYTDLALRSTFKQRCFNQTLIALLHPDINLQNIKSQMIILHGNKDVIIPLKDIQQTSKLKGKLQVWQGLGHMIPIQSPKQYNERILKILANK